jgi:hypothetical protein
MWIEIHKITLHRKSCSFGIVENKCSAGTDVDPPVITRGSLAMSSNPTLLGNSR